MVHPPVRRNKLLAIVGERPDKYELRDNAYFAGPTGELMDQRILLDAGFRRSDCSQHNAIICIPAKKLTPAEWKRATACCAPRLAIDLRVARPKVVIAAGKQALLMLAGKSKITDWVGAPMRGWAFREKGEGKKYRLENVDKGGLADFQKYQILPVMHPAWHFRDAWQYLPMSRIHFMRARLLAEGKLKAWKWAKIVIDPNATALKLLQSLQSAGLAGQRISFDVETLGENPFGDPIAIMGLGHRRLGSVALPWETYVAGKYGRQLGVVDAPVASIAAQCRDLALAILADSRIEKCAQNGQYDCMCLQYRNIPFAGPIYDTMDAHATYAPALKHGLGLICAIEFSAPRWKTAFHAGDEVKGKDKWQAADPVRFKTYNGQDNIMQSHLEHRCEERIAETHRGAELLASYQALRMIANKMTWRGVRVSRKRRRFHHHQLRTRMGKAEAELMAVAAQVKLKNFNINAPASWAGLFFKKLGVAPTKWSETTGTPSLDETALTPLLTHPNQLVQIAARAGLRYRKWATLDRNHVKGLRLDTRSVVHPFWRPTGTIGQRWSGSKPNPQNISKPVEQRMPDGSRKVIHGGLRDMFIPQTYRGWMVEGDYKQLELRLIAILAGDESLLKTFIDFDAGKGPDPHTVNAINLFGIVNREPSETERTLAKNFVYNVDYGGDANSIFPVLATDTPIKFSLVVKMIERWWKAHQAIKRWQDKIILIARKQGYVEEPVSGRRRHFWEASHAIKDTEVYNFPVQTLAGWIINEAIKDVDKRVNWSTEGICFQAHDALILDGPEPGRLADILLDCMQRTVVIGGKAMRFPIDLKVGRSWGSAQKMKRVQLDRLPVGVGRMAV